MRRLRLALLAAVAGASPVAAFAQADPVGEAVVQTVIQADMRARAQNVPGYTGEPWDAVVVAATMLEGIAVTYATCGQGTNWVCIAHALGIPTPFPLGWGSRSDPKGRFDGSGATGSWNNPEAFDCSEFDFRFDPQGNFVIPSLPLRGGGPLKLGQASSGGTLAYLNNQGSPATYAVTQEAALLRRYHHINMARAKQAWFGAYSVAGGSAVGASVAYYDGAGVLVPRATSSPTNQAGPVTAPLNCPSTETTGGDFDFYIEGSCRAYAPNLSLSPSGYAYSPETSVPLAIWTTGNGLADVYTSCGVDPEFIAELAEAIWEEASEQPGYDGPPPIDVLPEDVRTGDTVPQVEDVLDPPADPTVPAEPDPTPEPYPTPTPSPTPSGSAPDYDPTVTTPELISSEIDWWPDLPTINVDLGNPSCPTYPFTVPGYEWNLVIESHCPVIEQNRAAISTIMLALFAIWGILIVLRA